MLYYYYNIVELVTQITSPQPPTTSGHVDGHQLCGTRAFGHTWNYCPKNKLLVPRQII